MHFSQLVPVECQKCITCLKKTHFPKCMHLVTYTNEILYRSIDGNYSGIKETNFKLFFYCNLILTVFLHFNMQYTLLIAFEFKVVYRTIMINNFFISYIL